MITKPGVTKDDTQNFHRVELQGSRRNQEKRQGLKLVKEIPEAQEDVVACEVLDIHSQLKDCVLFFHSQLRSELYFVVQHQVWLKCCLPQYS